MIYTLAPILTSNVAILEKHWREGITIPASDVSYDKTTDVITARTKVAGRKLIHTNLENDHLKTKIPYIMIISSKFDVCFSNLFCEYPTIFYPIAIMNYIQTSNPETYEIYDRIRNIVVELKA